MTLQKDPGEGWHLPYGFDHMAAYLQYQRSSNWQKLLAGDFHFSFGQGFSELSVNLVSSTFFKKSVYLFLHLLEVHVALLVRHVSILFRHFSILAFSFIMTI